MDNVIDAELLEVKDHGRQIGSLDLRVRVLLQVFIEGTLGEESVALAGPGTTSSTSSLFGTSATDRTHQE